MTAFALSIHPSTGRPLQLSEKTAVLADLTTLPTSDESVRRVYWVRHGESTANQLFFKEGKEIRKVSGLSAEVELTSEGVKQIAALAEQLIRCFPKGTKLTIVSSSIVRTKQTAKILFEKLIATHSDVIRAEDDYEGLNERSLGADWEGKDRDEKYEKALAPWTAMAASQKFYAPEVEGGESYYTVATRALSSMAEIYDRYPADRTILVVTSFNTINAAAIQLNGFANELSREPATDIPKLKLDNGDLVLIETDQKVGFEGAKIVSHIKSQERHK